MGISRFILKKIYLKYSFKILIFVRKVPFGCKVEVHPIWLNSLVVNLHGLIVVVPVLGTVNPSCGYLSGQYSKAIL